MADTTQVTVTTTPTRLVDLLSGDAARVVRSPKFLYVQAQTGNAVSVWIGFRSDITSSDAWELKPGDIMPFPVTDPGHLFVVCASGSPKLDVAWG